LQDLISFDGILYFPAMRFALMEAKVVLSKLLLAGELHPAPGHEEIVLEPGLGIIRVKGGVKVTLKAL